MTPVIITNRSLGRPLSMSNQRRVHVQPVVTRASRRKHRRLSPKKLAMLDILFLAAAIVFFYGLFTWIFNP